METSLQQRSFDELDNEDEWPTGDDDMNIEEAGQEISIQDDEKTEEPDQEGEEEENDVCFDKTEEPDEDEEKAKEDYSPNDTNTQHDDDNVQSLHEEKNRLQNLNDALHLQSEDLFKAAESHNVEIEKYRNQISDPKFEAAKARRRDVKHKATVLKIERSVKKNSSCKEFIVGDTVTAKCRDSKGYSIGSIHAKNDDDTYDIKFMDGDRDKVVLLTNIKPGMVQKNYIQKENLMDILSELTAELKSSRMENNPFLFEQDDENMMNEVIIALTIDLDVDESA